MPTWFIVWRSLLAAFFSVTTVIEFNRTRDIKALATRNGFVSLGRDLPKSVCLTGTGIENMSSIWNAYEGKSHRVRIIFFDCRIGYGKGSWRRTVIAAEAPRDIFENIPSDHSMAVDRCGQWQILYEQKAGMSFRLSSLMPVGELEARINAIHP